MQFDAVSNCIRFYEQMPREAQRDFRQKKDDSIYDSAHILLSRISRLNSMELEKFNKAIQQRDELQEVWDEREAARREHELQTR